MHALPPLSPSLLFGVYLRLARRWIERRPDRIGQPNLQEASRRSPLLVFFLFPGRKWAKGAEVDFALAFALLHAGNATHADGTPHVDRSSKLLGFCSFLQETDLLRSWADSRCYSSLFCFLPSFSRVVFCSSSLADLCAAQASLLVLSWGFADKFFF